MRSGIWGHRGSRSGTLEQSSLYSRFVFAARTWCKSASAAGGSALPAVELKHQTRTLLQALAPAPSASSALTLQAGTGDVQV